MIDLNTQFWNHNGHNHKLSRKGQLNSVRFHQSAVRSENCCVFIWDFQMNHFLYFTNVCIFETKVEIVPSFKNLWIDLKFTNPVTNHFYLLSIHDPYFEMKDFCVSYSYVKSLRVEKYFSFAKGGGVICRLNRKSAIDDSFTFYHWRCDLSQLCMRTYCIFWLFCYYTRKSWGNHSSYELRPQWILHA